MAHSGGLAARGFDVAIEQYRECYDNDAFVVATQGVGETTKQALIREAMALCGSPYHRVTRRRWNEDQLAFLALFV